MVDKNFRYWDGEKIVHHDPTSDSMIVNGLSSNADIDMQGNKITGGSDPTNPTDYATRNYVDNARPSKNQVDAATTVDITLSGAQTIDGVSVTTGMRVLVKNQTSAVENGIYVADSGAWSRSADMAAGSSASGSIVFVDDGSAAQADTGWMCSTNSGSDLVGTDPLAFYKFTPEVTDPNLIHVFNQAQFDAIASAVTGNHFIIHNGTYSRSTPIQISASGVTIEGLEGVLITMPDGVNNQVFRVDGDDVKISNLRIDHLGNPSTASVGILVHGTPDNVIIKDCWVTGFWNCYQVTGTDIDNRIDTIRFDNCFANSFDEGWYGYLFDYVDNIEAINCRAFECGADGFKVANGSSNIKVLGGDYSRCGMTTTPGVNGQGMDLFSGGDTVIVDGVSFRGNGVNTPVGGGGLLLKSSTGSGSPTTGHMKKIVVSNCQLMDSIGGDNLVVFTEPVMPEVPLIQSVTITGNVIDGGDQIGVRLGGANINFSGNVIRKAANDGVLVDAKSVRTIIANNVFVANSFGNPNSYHSLTILGQQVLVDGNVFDGKLDDDAIDESEIDASTAYPQRHVYATGAGVIDVRVTDNNIYNGSVSSIPVRFTSSVGAGCMWDSTDTILPNSGGRYGNPGSTYRRHNAISDETLFWVKPISSAVDNPFGWVERYKFDAQLTDIGLLKDVDTTTTAPTDGDILSWVNANSNWEPLDPATLDHGNFAGLGDDDHTIYLLADGSRDVTGSLNLNSASPSITVGDGSGVPLFVLDSGDTSDGQILYQDNGSNRWLLEVDGSSEAFHIGRYNSIGVFQDFPFTIDQTNGHVTIGGAGDFYVNNLIRLNSDDGSIIVGNGSGDPNVTFRKSNTGASDIFWQTDSGSGLNNHWSLNFSAVEDLIFERRNADGTANDSPLRLDWSDGNIYIINDVEVGGSANIYGDDGDALNVRTQTTGFVGTQLKKRTKGVQSTLVGTSSTYDVATLGTIATNGQNMKFRVWITAVDNTSNSDVSSAVIEQMAYRSSGTVTLATEHRNSKQGNGAFNADAGWSLVVSGDDVILRFANTSNSVSYTINCAVEWEIQEGGFSS